MKSFRSIILVIVFVLNSAEYVLAQWIQTNGPYGGDVTAFALDSTIGSISKLYAVTYRGDVYRSSNKGVDWLSIGQLDVQTNAMISYNSHLFVGAGDDGIFRTSDDGESWENVNTGLFNCKIIAIAASDEKIIAGGTAGSQSNLFYSTNFGTSWTAINTTYSNKTIFSLAVLDTIIFAGTPQGIFRVIKNGIRWIAEDAGLMDRKIYRLERSVMKLFAGTDSGIFYTVDNGLNWTRTDSILNNHSIYSLSVCGKNIIAGTDDSGVYVSNTMGETWSHLGSINVNVYAVIGCGPDLLIGTTHGAYYSGNNGNNWMSVGFDRVAIINMVAVGEKVYACTDGIGLGGVFYSTNMGEEWYALCLTNRPISSLVIEGSHLIAGTSSYLLLSDNDGRNWSKLFLDANRTSISSLITNNNHIFAANWGSGIYHSIDSGKNWSNIDSGLTNKYIDHLAIMDTILIAGSSSYEGGVFRSTDEGKNWTAINVGLSDIDVCSFAVLEKDFYVATDDGVFISTDFGTTWLPSNSGLPSFNPVFSFIDYNTNLFAATAIGGVYCSENQGLSWHEVNSGLLNLNTISLAIQNNNLYVGTERGGLWRRPLNEMLSTVIQRSTYSPNKFTLFQNYPNPFNPKTKIEFDIKELTPVTLGIYSVDGRLVEELIRATLNSGRYSATWDAQSMSSGLYFYRLTAGNYSATKKLVIVK